MRLLDALVAVFSVIGFVSTPVGAAEPAKGQADDPARQAIVTALATGGDVPGQARNLAKLAWPDGKRDEVVAARARIELAHFGDRAYGALRNALNTAKISYSEEIVKTTLDAQREARVEFAPEYLSTVIDAIWIGSRGAKVLAIQALRLDHNMLAVAPMIDSAIADPALATQVVETLGTMRYPQARFYLETVMMEGPLPLRSAAASSLAQIGGAALGPLKNALKAPERETRLLAVRALLPAATEYDLGAIYEYIEKHGDDDPALTQALRLSAYAIEQAIAARDAKAAADSPKDF